MMKMHSLSSLAIVFALSLSAQGAYTQIASLAEVLGTSTATGFNAFAIEGNNLFATVSGPSNTYAITKVSGLGGVKTSSILTNTAAVDAVNGTATNLSGSTGFGLRAAGSLQFADSNSGSIYRVNTSTGAISTYVSKATIDTALSITNSQILGVHGNTSTGEYAFYQSRAGSRALMATTGAGSVSTLINSAGLLALNGVDQIAGGIASQSGLIYFSTGASGSRNLYSYSLSLATTALVYTEAQLALLNTNNTGFSLTEMFAAPDGLVYLRNGQSKDILSFNPAAPSTSLSLVISSAALVGGAAATDALTHLDWYDGKLAFAVTSSAGGAVPGVYAIPEVSSFALTLGALTLLGLRRRR